MEVGEPNDSWTGDGRSRSCCSALGDFPESTELLRGVLDAIGGGRGVPTILAYGSQGEEGLEPLVLGENLWGDCGWEDGPCGGPAPPS